MIRQGLMLAVGAVLLAAIATPTNAAGRMHGKYIVIHGCAYPVPPACTNINSGTTVYTLHSARPVPVHVGVTIVGVRTGDVSLCFGVPLKVVKWSRNRMRCPLY